MILRQISLTNVGCFPYTVTLGPFGDGLNLVYAPNETGKSTIVTAVGRALFDRHGAGGVKIAAMRPWGTTVAPTVSLVLEAGGDEYALEKRFLQNPSSQLRLSSAVGFEAFRDGDAADAFVRELLHGELRGHGATDVNQWGLARTLWCLQEPGRESMCTVSETVAGQLRKALPGSLTSSTRYERLAGLVQARYAQSYTETHRVKVNSEEDALNKALEKLAQQIAEQQEGLANAEQAGQDLQQASTMLTGLDEQRQKHRDLLAQYEAEARRLQELQLRIKGGDQELKGLATQQSERVADREACAEKLDEAARLTAHVKTLEQEIAKAQAERLRLQGGVHELAALAAEARTRREEAAQRWRRALAVKDARQAQRELAELAQTLDRLAHSETQAAEVARELERQWPGDPEVAAGRELQERITGLQAQLQIAGLSLTISVEHPQRVEVTGGADFLAVDAEPGLPVTYQAGASLEVALPGTANLRVTSGAREAAEIGGELQTAQQELVDLLAPFQVAEVHSLVDLQVTHQELERQRKELANEIKRLAGLHRNRAGLEKQQAILENGLQALLAELQLSAEALEAEEPGDEGALKTAEEQARTAQDEAELRLETLQGSLAKAQETEQGLSQERTRHETGAQIAGTQAQTLLQRHHVENLEALMELECAAEEDLRQRQEALAALRAEVPAADPEELAAAQRQALEEIERDRTALGVTRVRAELLIEQAQTQGRYEDLVLLEEQRQAATAQLEQVRLQAHAVSLLRQVLNERRQETVSPQLPHLEEAIQRMMEAITRRSRPIKVGDQYSVEGMRDTSGREDVHGPEALSAGTREQLDLVTRLALGEAYAREYGRTMMVLDDALLYTDPDRHERLKPILRRAAQQLQIFIFTSHPDRYRGVVAELYRFDLAELAAQARQR